jgi:hypothetical protein
MRRRAIREALVLAAFVGSVVAFLIWFETFLLLVNIGWIKLAYDGGLQLWLTLSLSLLAGALAFYWKFSRRSAIPQLENSMKKLRLGTQDTKLEDAIFALDSLVTTMPEMMSQITDDIWYYAGLAFVVGLFLGGFFPFGIILGILFGGSVWTYSSRRAMVRIKAEIRKYKEWSARLSQQKEDILGDL